jgi:hypothetical protein
VGLVPHGKVFSDNLCVVQNWTASLDEWVYHASSPVFREQGFVGKDAMKTYEGVEV